jgi:hypothetical protein
VTARRRTIAEPLPDRQLDVAGVAELVGVEPTTIRAHRRLGRMPAADGILGGRVWWWESTIRAWMRDRPGPGRPRNGSRPG